MASGMACLIFRRLVSWRSLRKMQPGRDCFFIPMRQMTWKPFPILTTEARVKRELTLYAFTWTLRRPRGVAISLSRQLSVKARGKSRTSFFQKSWRVLRILFIATGVLFWGIGGVFLVARKTGLLKLLPHPLFESIREKMVQQQVAAIYQFDPSEFQQGGPPLPKARWVDIQLKTEAVKTVLKKIQDEDAFVKIFGYPVVSFPCRSYGRGGSSNTELDSIDHMNSEGVWKVWCYLDGPKSSGLLTLKFQKDKNAWIPVSLQLETFTGQSIEMITSVSAPLPNGLTRFTHLMDGW